MFNRNALDDFSLRLAAGLSAVLFATACGAVDPSTQDEVDAGELDSLGARTEALTPDDGNVQSLTLRMSRGDAKQIAYTHNAAKIELETAVDSGKVTVSAPLTGVQRGQVTLKVTCVNPGGASNVKSKTGVFNLAAGGNVVYSAVCDATYRATKSDLVISPSDGTGLKVEYEDLPVPPTADQDITVVLKAGDVTSHSYHFVKNGFLRFDLAPASETAFFRYQNDTSQVHQLRMIYRIQCNGTWGAATTKDLIMDPKRMTNLRLTCPDGQQLERAETRLQDLR